MAGSRPATWLWSAVLDLIKGSFHFQNILCLLFRCRKLQKGCEQRMIFTCFETALCFFQRVTIFDGLSCRQNFGFGLKRRFIWNV